jgi:hypothetical protein
VNAHADAAKRRLFFFIAIFSLRRYYPDQVQRV